MPSAKKLMCVSATRQGKQSPTSGNWWESLTLESQTFLRGCCSTTGVTGGHYRSVCFPYADGTKAVSRRMQALSHIKSMRCIHYTACLFCNQPKRDSRPSGRMCVYRCSMLIDLCPLIIPTSMGFSPFSKSRVTASWRRS